MMGEGDSQMFMASPSGSSFCGKCTVLSGQIKIFFADGTPANVETGIYTHHILTNGMGSQPGFINSGIKGFAGAAGAGFVGAGDDNGNRPWVYAPKDKEAAGFESGYHITPQTRFNAQIVLVNYNKQPKTVCVAYDLEYLDGLVGKKVKSSLISAAGLMGPKTDRSRAVNTTSSAMPFSEPGYIVTAKGHLRKFEEQIEVERLLTMDNRRRWKRHVHENLGQEFVHLRVSGHVRRSRARHQPEDNFGHVGLQLQAMASGGRRLNDHGCGIRSQVTPSVGFSNSS
jgi:hypothetical protein